MAQNYSASGSELATQYKDASNLAARQQIYQFAVDRNPNWYRWVFDQLQEALRSRNDRDAVAVLELGCGN